MVALVIGDNHPNGHKNNRHYDATSCISHPEYRPGCGTIFQKFVLFVTTREMREIDDGNLLSCSPSSL